MRILPLGQHGRATGFASLSIGQAIFEIEVLWKLV